MTLSVYADQSIPSDRIAPGPFSDEIKRRIGQKLLPAGIALANEDEAEAVLSVSFYLSCEPDGPSCGYHTTVELREWVLIERDLGINAVAITWRNGYSNGIGNKDVWCCLSDLLTVDALSLISGFIEDYRTANRK